MKNSQAKVALSALVFFTVSAGVAQMTPDVRPSTAAQVIEPVSRFPEIARDTDRKLDAEIRTVVKRNMHGISADDLTLITNNIRHYMLFLGLTDQDFRRAGQLPTADPDPQALAANTLSGDEDAGEDGNESGPSNLRAIQRIFNASTQFVFCPDLSDWACLEKTPKMTPTSAYRHENRTGLGTAVAAGASLNMEVFFTEAWDGSAKSGVANRMAERLHSDSGRSLSIAMYGIDDIGASMKPVFDEIISADHNHSNVRAVVDVRGLEVSRQPWIFNYVKPAGELANRWLFASPAASPDAMHVSFQYNGTPELLRELNNGVRSAADSKVRLEWPNAHIMHNKFAVLENSHGQKSVWTGTANISRTCMGEESNANMVVYIRNNYIAKAYQDEFNHMFEFDPALRVTSRLVVNSDASPNLQVGRFHHNKTPVSQRLFKFTDGTQVRVHFAPSDDAEHRVILPMLYSAKQGDEIRISMFGGTGFEIIRAMQYAAARGANIKIIMDHVLGHGQTSWIRDRVLSIYSANPYKNLVSRPGAMGKIEARLSSWSGMNHYKVGTLTRKQSAGNMVAEQIILGSQNWSSGGNDDNDENLLSIRNLRSGVDAAKRFNEEFDRRLWVNSAVDQDPASDLATEGQGSVSGEGQAPQVVVPAPVQVQPAPVAGIPGNL